MKILQSIILGLVQGLTEFLPVSSSGHLIVFKKLFGIDHAFQHGRDVQKVTQWQIAVDG